MPIIPTVLVNGSEGIGTGWSSYVPNFNPRDIIANVRRLLNGDAMSLWIHGINGLKELLRKLLQRKEGIATLFVELYRKSMRQL